MPDKTRRARALRYYYAHREEMIAASTRWAAEHPERALEYQRKYHERNRERINALARARYKAHPRPPSAGKPAYQAAYHEKRKQKTGFSSHLSKAQLAAREGKVYDAHLRKWVEK